MKDVNTAYIKNIQDSIKNVEDNTLSLTNSIPLPADASTATLQTTGNTKLDTLIDLLGKSLTVKFDEIVKDAADSVRVSTKTILGDYVQDVDNLPLLLNRVGTGTQTWSQGVVTMSVTAGQYAICQSYARHKYYPGKSHLIEITFNDMIPKVGVVKRQGYFSSNLVAPYDSNKDGIWIESDAVSTYFVISKGGVETRIERSTWDDPLDGNGASGINLDLDNFNILAFDFLYLGGSAVTFSFKVGRKLVLAHIHQNSGLNTSTMILSPTQPYRAEIRSTTGVGSMGQVCATINTEGPVNVLAQNVPTSPQINYINANDTGVTYLVKAVRLKPTAVNSVAAEFAQSTLASTNDQYVWSLRINPTIGGTALTWTDIPNSYLQEADAEFNPINPSTNTVTGGLIIDRGYAIGANSGVTDASEIKSNSKLGFSVDGTPTVLALCVTPIGSGLDIKGLIKVKQL